MAHFWGKSMANALQFAAEKAARQGIDADAMKRASDLVRRCGAFEDRAALVRSVAKLYERIAELGSRGG